MKLINAAMIKGGGRGMLRKAVGEILMEILVSSALFLLVVQGHLLYPSDTLEVPS